MSALNLECADCWAMRVLAGLGDLGACPKHANAEQKAAAHEQILKLGEAGASHAAGQRRSPMTTPPTSDERIQCLADTIAVTSKTRHGTTVRTQVREYPAWTAADGEEFPAEWVVEIRFGKPFRVAILELEAWRALRRTPGAWQDLVLMEVA